MFGLTVPIWYYSSPIDFRKQMDGLVVVIASMLEKNPTSGELFVFRNRQATRLKMLWWDTNGFWLFYRRLEKQRFKLPKATDECLTLSGDQLTWLLSGLDFTQFRSFNNINSKYFY